MGWARRLSRPGSQLGSLLPSLVPKNRSESHPARPRRRLARGEDGQQGGSGSASCLQPASRVAGDGPTRTPRSGGTSMEKPVGDEAGFRAQDSRKRPPPPFPGEPGRGARAQRMEGVGREDAPVPREAAMVRLPAAALIGCVPRASGTEAPGCFPPPPLQRERRGESAAAPLALAASGRRNN